MNTAAVVNSPHYAALVKFIEAINRSIEAYWAKNRYTFAKPSKVFVHSVGKKYAKLVEYRERNGKFEADSVYCFFDYNTGDLLKAASWSAVAPNGVRGNVNEPNVLSKFGVYGPEYLR